MEAIITKEFFEDKTTIELARDILGMRLVHQTDEEILSGLIVETEAYLGQQIWLHIVFKTSERNEQKSCFHRREESTCTKCIAKCCLIL